MRVFCEPLFAAGPFDIDLRAYQLLFRLTSEDEDAAGGIYDAATAEVVAADAVGAGDEEAVGVGM